MSLFAAAGVLRVSLLGHAPHLPDHGNHSLGHLIFHAHADQAADSVARAVAPSDMPPVVADIFLDASAFDNEHTNRRLHGGVDKLNTHFNFPLSLSNEASAGRSPRLELQAVQVKSISMSPRKSATAAIELFADARFSLFTVLLVAT